ncbi:helix-turn-helix domain-containing protein [Rhizosphaericola mali]|uniref:Helix-turn-helix domain-containing protein n=1 Tax=Rhizosphaericola mali TaxID=2545455 RepID=A0A5P2G4I1_9BACT|nr:AraC family transcriptional regulator [Rhizosphaericola mali]QES88670.1 helix-turn-helix domain-containing protein [Rhizosphaericola mali]
MVIKTNFVPRQLLLNDLPIKLIPFDQFVHELSQRPHRHDHYTLMWITKGHGFQNIDEQLFEMRTNRLFFIHPGQIHKMLDLEREGWLLLFDEVIYKTFLRYHPSEELYGIMDNTADSPFVDLDQHTTSLFEKIFQILEVESKNASSDSNLFAHLISILILNANKLFDLQKNIVTIERNGEKEIVRKVKHLIEKNFKHKQNVEFYSQQLNIQPRRLNNITKTIIGLSVHELLEERLLTESKILLETSPYTVKEICYTLGFTDPSYYNRFFKKKSGITPLQFRHNLKLKKLG